ncbi:MAG: prepilin-type N-terminal cleavage/methylation domain-containing protein [Verrucomicrobiales bacterium]
MNHFSVLTLTKKQPFHRSKKRSRSNGFSLVELLVVIAVIGIIATLAIGKVSRIVENGRKIVAQRNAQTIAQVAASAQAAGNESIEVAADLDAAIQLLADSATGMGTLADMKFSLSEIGPAEIAEAKSYLDFVNGSILYLPQN